MPTFDNVLNVDQSLSLRGLRKFSKAQLLVALSNNEQIATLRAQMARDSSNLSKLLSEQNQALFSIQKKQVENEQRLLQQEISRLEHAEVQKFHRERAVRLKEILHDFKSAKDPYIQNVFMSDFILPSRELIDESINELDEIGDKEYCLNLKHGIREILEREVSPSQPLNELYALLDKKQKVAEIQKKGETIFKSRTELSDDLKRYHFEEQDAGGYKEIAEYERRLKNRKIYAIISVIAVAMLLLSIIGGNTDGAEGFIAFVIAAAIFVYRYYSLRSHRGQLNAEIEARKENLRRRITEIKEKNSVNENLLKQIKSDEIKALSNYRKSLSDLIEGHPEFLKFEYLLDLYKI